MILQSIITELKQKDKHLKDKNIFYENQFNFTEHNKQLSPSKKQNIIKSKQFDILFTNILIFNAEHKSLNENSIQQLCNYIFTQYSNNIELDNDENAKNILIEYITNTLYLSLKCNNSSQSKSDLTSYLTELYDSDDNDSFKDNFYKIFHNIKTI